MKFSVIVPIYNCDKYLRECLDSVLSQTFQDWECICVDDGSTDKSGIIAGEYADKDSRFKVIHKKNGGEGSARNAGLDNFSGDWVYFLDSDDILNKHTLEVCNTAVSRHPQAEVVGLKFVQYPDGESPNWSEDNNSRFEYFDISQSVPAVAFGTGVWATAFKRDIVEKFRFNDFKVGADRVFVTSVIDETAHFVYCDFIGYGYRVRLGSIVNTPLTRRKYLDDVNHYAHCINLINNSKKAYNKSILKAIPKTLREYFGNSFFKLSKTERKESLSEYCNVLKLAADCKHFTRFQRFLLSLVGRSKSQLSIFILGKTPYWLKSHGFNRKFKILKSIKPKS